MINNNTTPLVSIIIPCYNHEKFVQQTLQSVIDQDYLNIELIIIDDGSSDNSVKKIQALLIDCKSRFVRFEFRHRPNKGLCATLNEALKWAKGEYFAPIASDDIILPHKTRVQVNCMLEFADNNIAGVFGNITLFSGASKTPSNPKKAKPIGTKLYSFDDVFLRNSKLFSPTALLNLQKVKHAGGYNESLDVEDFYLWLKLTETGDKLLYIDEVLTLYRRHEGNLSKNTKLITRNVENILLRYNQHPQYDKALSFSYLLHANALINDGNSSHFKPFKLLFLAFKTYPLSIFSKRSIRVAYYAPLFIFKKH